MTTVDAAAAARRVAAEQIFTSIVFQSADIIRLTDATVADVIANDR